MTRSVRTLRWLPLALAAACAEPACPRTGFVDRDGDGVGGEPVGSTCPGDRSIVERGGDCDDNRADISPDATEDCGPVDLDCDGHPTDGAPPLRWFWDRDGDGYGTEGTTDALGCAPPSSAYVAVGGDCDPYDAARHPDRAEVPFNGLDDDCDDATRDDDGDQDGVGRAVDCDDADATRGAPGDAFVDVTSSAGLTSATQRVAFASATCSAAAFGGAVAVADIDQDRDLDLYLAGLDSRGHLMRNRGDGTFDDVSVAAGMGTVPGATAALFFDIEGDGDDDLLVASATGAPNHLYVNDGSGRFLEQAASRGAALPTFPLCSGHFSATASDLDGDGDLDVHLPSWSYLLPIVSPSARTLINDGTGHFTLAPADPALTATAHAGFASGFADADGDGRRDLFLTGDFGTSALFLARGDGPTRSFLDVTVAAGVGLDDNGMGSAIADYDGDGDLDWFVSSIFPTALGCYDQSPGCTGNKLYRNRGDGVFDEVASAAGVVDGGWGWGAAFFDADHDGDLDLVHATGFDTFGHDVPAIRYFEADGAGAFEERACTRGLVTSRPGRAVVPFDADGDLDLDLLVTEMLGPPRLFRNDATGARRGARIRLSDPVSRNPSAIGAVVQVRVTPTSLPIRRDITANASFAGVGPAEVHVGLGGYVGPLAEVVVTWPDGGVQRFTDVPTATLATLVRARPAP